MPASSLDVQSALPRGSSGVLETRPPGASAPAPPDAVAIDPGHLIHSADSGGITAAEIDAAHEAAAAALARLTYIEVCHPEHPSTGLPTSRAAYSFVINRLKFAQHMGAPWQARHALASGRVSGDAKDAVAPGVSGHLDWDEFMQRQTSFLHVSSVCIVTRRVSSALQFLNWCL